jgi:hypothetical protein
MVVGRSHKSFESHLIFAYYLLHVGFLLGLFINPQNSGETFLQNIG